MSKRECYLIMAQDVIEYQYIEQKQRTEWMNDKLFIVPNSSSRDCEHGVKKTYLQYVLNILKLMIGEMYHRRRIIAILFIPRWESPNTLRYLERFYGIHCVFAPSSSKYDYIYSLLFALYFTFMSNIFRNTILDYKSAVNWEYCYIPHVSILSFVNTSR